MQLDKFYPLDKSYPLFEQPGPGLLIVLELNLNNGALLTGVAVLDTGLVSGGAGVFPAPSGLVCSATGSGSVLKQYFQVAFVVLA